MTASFTFPDPYALVLRHPYEVRGLALAVSKFCPLWALFCLYSLNLCGEGKPSHSKWRHSIVPLA